jgi:hypothetical protein
MPAMGKQIIHEFKMQLRDVLPSRFKVDAWATDTGAKYWRCEIRVGRDLYWGEFKISDIATPYALEVLVRAIKSHMPGVRCST